MEIDDLALKIESHFSPEQIRRQIDKEFRGINFGAEMGQAIFSPFDESDIWGRRKPRPSEYLPKNALLNAQLLGFELSRKNITGKKFLSVGAGTSPLGAEINRLGGFAIDLDPHVLPTNGRAVKAKGENLPFADTAYDEVLLAHTLCVVNNPEDVLRETNRVTKSGGVIRIYPAVAFVDLRTILRPGLKAFRLGLDDFRLEWRPGEDPDTGKTIKLLTDQSIMTVKPDENFWKKRISGHYYKKYPDDLWLGDTD